jgi:hypothetical protein
VSEDPEMSAGDQLIEDERTDDAELAAEEGAFEPEVESDDTAPSTAFSPVTFSQSNRRISDLFNSRKRSRVRHKPGLPARLCMGQGQGQ